MIKKKKKKKKKNANHSLFFFLLSFFFTKTQRMSSLFNDEPERLIDFDALKTACENGHEYKAMELTNGNRHDPRWISAVAKAGKCGNLSLMQKLIEKDMLIFQESLAMEVSKTGDIETMERLLDSKIIDKTNLRLLARACWNAILNNHFYFVTEMHHRKRIHDFSFIIPYIVINVNTTPNGSKEKLQWRDKLCWFTIHNSENSSEYTCCKLPNQHQSSSSIPVEEEMMATKPELYSQSLGIRQK